MKHDRSTAIGEALAGWALRAQAGGWRVTGAILLVTLALAGYAGTHLGVNADNQRLLAPDLPFQLDRIAFERHFPALTEALLIVVDGESPELASDAARKLSAALAAREDAFGDVFVPGSEPFFERSGLLYRTPDEIEEFGDQLLRFQPMLAALSRDPSLAPLTQLLERGLLEADPSEIDAAWPTVLDGFRRATVEVYSEHPVAVSWEELLLEGSSLDPRRRRVIVADPILDYDRILPARRAMGAVREEAAGLGLDPERGVQVRITGYPALNHEEMIGLVTDIGLASVASFAFVGLMLVLAMGWGRLVACAALTLGVGLVWTAAFAAAAVGQLSLVSIAFAVLFIGLGADFAIHMGLHLVTELRSGAAPREALRAALRDVGAALLLCTLTTAIGFWAFVPTDYRGVGELGLIAGMGMVVIFFLTLTLLPALLGERRPPEGDGRNGEAGLREAVTGFAERRPGTVLAVSALLVVVAVALLPRTRFDSNVVALRDPSTESVRTFEDLLASGQSSPWTIELLSPDLEDAEHRAERLEELEVVERATTLADYVPTEQEEKLEILADLALIFEAPTAPPTASEPDLQEQLDALASLASVLGGVRYDGSLLAETARRLREEITSFLERVGSSSEPEAELARLEELLLGGFPERMRRLRASLAAEPVGLEDLPETLVSRMRSEDGTLRIQVFPRGDLRDAVQLAHFVAEVRELEPAATGLPVNIVEFGRYTAKSLREAFLGALGAIALLLLLLWRRPLDAALALAPVTMAALVSVATMALLDRPFNFANVIVLPLLLGVGVDSGIHLVRRARSSEVALGSTATARAVFFSAITTLVSFGSLALAGHRGTASLGVLLVIGMLWTLACNLIMLPALLSWSARPSAQAGPTVSVGGGPGDPARGA